MDGGVFLITPPQSPYRLTWMPFVDPFDVGFRPCILALVIAGGFFCLSLFSLSTNQKDLCDASHPPELDLSVSLSLPTRFWTCRLLTVIITGPMAATILFFLLFLLFGEFLLPFGSPPDFLLMETRCRFFLPSFPVHFHSFRTVSSFCVTEAFPEQCLGQVRPNLSYSTFRHARG